MSFDDGELGPEAEPQHEGEHYLGLLGMEGLADREIQRADGSVIQARDFLDVCGDHARPLLVGFEAMSPDDPRYDTLKQALQTMITGYVNQDSNQ